MGGDYLGKTNKELIIEVIGKVEGIQKQLTECRPVCFRNENEVIKIREEIRSVKWFIGIIAAFITIGINAIAWFIKKLNGG